MSKFPWEVSAISAIVGIGVGYGVKSYLDKKGSARENPALSKLDEVKAYLDTEKYTLNSAKDVLEYVLSQKDDYLNIADIEERFESVDQIIHDAFEDLDDVLTEQSPKLKAILDTCTADDKTEIEKHIEDILAPYYDLEDEIFKELELNALMQDDSIEDKDEDEDEDELEEKEEEEELEDLVSTKLNKDHAQRIIESMKHQMLKHAKKSK